MKPAICFVVGEGLLALETARALLRPGFSLAGVLSEDASVARFCEQQTIPRYTQRAAFVAAMAEVGLDLLFSVNNPWIVPAHVLALPRSAAINFHDSLLPNYGGLFATSWALINGEAQHGISWHVMRPAIDSGEVLVQRRLAVLADDTAHTLNARCFEAAKEGLLELLGKLETGTARGLPQPAVQGSYHGLSDRPWASGMLDFSRDAHSLARLVRALDFGSVKNPFAAAKCALAGELFIVSRAQVQAQPDSQPGTRTQPIASPEPGVCLACTAAGLSVQTADGVLVLQELRSLLGQRTDLEACARRLGIAVGKPLSNINQLDRQRLDDRFRTLARREPFWIGQLTAARLQTRILPACPRREVPTTWLLTHFAQALARGAQAGTVGSVDYRLSVGGLVAAFVARLCAGSVVELGLGVAGLSRVEAACFARVVPLRIVCERSTVRDMLDVYQQTREQLGTHGSYARDLVARTPALRQHGEPHYELSIFDAEEPASDAPTDVAFDLHDAKQPQLISYTQLSAAQLEALDRALATFAGAALAQPHACIAELPLLDDSQRRT
ncbi:MAG: amino acid adenylation domain protein, partial [Myxococcaceae bacterium]|nr:amino acid adenylation domain protein [Myxococcaceae bacterium]